MIGEVTNALLEPFTETTAWYGIFAALAARKQIRRVMEFAVDKVIGRMEGDG